MKQLNQERANSVHSVRLYAAQILHLDPKFFKKNFNRASAPELRALLESPAEPDKKYPLLAPLIFPNCDVHSVYPFKCEPLATVRITPPYRLCIVTLFFSSFDLSYTGRPQWMVRVLGNAHQGECFGV